MMVWQQKCNFLCDMPALRQAKFFVDICWGKEWNVVCGLAIFCMRREFRVEFFIRFISMWCTIYNVLDGWFMGSFSVTPLNLFICLLTVYGLCVSVLEILLIVEKHLFIISFSILCPQTLYFVPFFFVVVVSVCMFVWHLKHEAIQAICIFIFKSFFLLYL